MHLETYARELGRDAVKRGYKKPEDDLVLQELLRGKFGPVQRGMITAWENGFKHAQSAPKTIAR